MLLSILKQENVNQLMAEVKRLDPHTAAAVERKLMAAYNQAAWAAHWNSPQDDIVVILKEISSVDAIFAVAREAMAARGPGARDKLMHLSVTNSKRHFRSNYLFCGKHNILMRPVAAKAEDINSFFLYYQGSIIEPVQIIDSPEPYEILSLYPLPKE